MYNMQKRDMAYLYKACSIIAAYATSLDFIDGAFTKRFSWFLPHNAGQSGPWVDKINWWMHYWMQLKIICLIRTVLNSSQDLLMRHIYKHKSALYTGAADKHEQRYLNW